MLSKDVVAANFDLSIMFRYTCAIVALVYMNNYILHYPISVVLAYQIF